LHYGITISGDDKSFTETEVETFSYTKNTKLTDEKIGDGEYLYSFEFVTPNNESVNSQYINFTVEGDNITTSVVE
jgi:hypothetical protein